MRVLLVPSLFTQSSNSRDALLLCLLPPLASCERFSVMSLLEQKEREYER